MDIKNPNDWFDLIKTMLFGGDSEDSSDLVADPYVKRARIFFLMASILMLSGSALSAAHAKLAPIGWSVLMVGLASGLFSVYLFWKSSLLGERPELKGAAEFGPKEGKLLRGLGHRGELNKLVSAVDSGQISLIIVYGAKGVGKTSLINSSLRLALDAKKHELRYVDAGHDDVMESIRAVDISPGGGKKLLVLVDNVNLMPELGLLKDFVDSFLAHPPRYGYNRILILITDGDDYDAVWRWEPWRRPRAVAGIKVEPLSVRDALDAAKILTARARVPLSGRVIRELVDDIAIDGKVSPLGLSVILGEIGKASRPVRLADYAAGGFSEGIIAMYIWRQLSDSVRKLLAPALAKLAMSPQPSFTVDDINLPKDNSAEVRLLFRDLSSSSARVLSAEREDGRFRIVKDWLPAAAILAETDIRAAGQKSWLRRRYERWFRQSSPRRLLTWFELRQVMFILDFLEPALRDFFNRSLKRRRVERFWVTACAIAILTIAVSYQSLFHKWLVGKRLDGWGLPRDLSNYSVHIKELSLAGMIDRIDWIPESVSWLDLDCARITTLAGISQSVKHLGVNGTRISSLEGLPSGVVELNIGNSHVESANILSGLPLSKLTALDLSGIDVPDLKAIPRSVRRLTLLERNMESLGGLPQGLVELDLQGARVNSLDLLPKGLTKLIFYQGLSGGEFDIDYLPPNLEFLETNGRIVRSLRSPVKLLDHLFLSSTSSFVPESVTQLELRGAVVQELGEDTLKKLRVLKFHDRFSYEHWTSGIPECIQQLKLKLQEDGKFGVLPRKLAGLDLSGSSIRSIEGLEKAVPDLAELNVSAIVGLLSLKGVPSKVKELRFESCFATTLVDFPPALTGLYLGSCSNLSSLKNLPRSLVELQVQETMLRGLDGLAGLHNLKRLNISGSNIVDHLPPLPSSLEELTLKVGQVRTLEGLPPSIRKLTFVTNEKPQSASSERQY